MLIRYPRGFDHLPDGFPARRVLCSSRRRQNKTPSTSRDTLGALFWRRPTLARPIAVLPSGLQRFTSVFGMGTGGATALLSPECGTALAVRCCRSDAGAKPSLWGLASDTDTLQFNFER